MEISKYGCLTTAPSAARLNYSGAGPEYPSLTGSGWIYSTCRPMFISESPSVNLCESASGEYDTPAPKSRLFEVRSLFRDDHAKRTWAPTANSAPRAIL